MNKKRTFLDKALDFVSGKGFYLAVLVCVAAIALSGFYLTRTLRGGLAGLEEDQPVGGSASITVTPTPVPTPKVTAAPTPAPTADPTPAPTPDATPQVTQTALVFTWPVEGSVIAPFSVEVLSYDVTMEDWRTHSGIDIAAALGTQVLAVSDGVVSAVYEDDLMGTTVVVEHGGGLFSVYSNLDLTPTVAVGDPVSASTVLGAVGSTASAESGLEPHLHLAMYQDEQPVNPEDYLPQ